MVRVLPLHGRGYRSESYAAHMKTGKSKAQVGVGVLVSKNNEILLIKRKGSHGAGTWAPPGGHIDFGESVLDCAKREVKEEIGIKIKNFKVIGFTEDLFKKDRKHYITIWVKSNWQSGKINTSYREFSKINWFSWKKLPQPLFIPLKNFVEGYWDGLATMKRRIYMLKNNKEFRETATKAYRQFYVK